MDNHHIIKVKLKGIYNLNINHYYLAERGIFQGPIISIETKKFIVIAKDEYINEYNKATLFVNNFENFCDVNDIILVI